MTTALKKFFHGQPSTAGQVVYTCPANTTAIVLGRVITNPSKNPLTVRLGLIPSGATADGTHYLLADALIQPNDAFESDSKIILTAGDTLEAQSAALPAPIGLTVTSNTTGGTLAATTYYYKITATNAAGETIGSVEVPVTTTGTTSSVAVAWTRSLGATGYKIYRSTTSGAEALVATVAGGATTTTVDTGTATTAPTPPTTGTAAACTFTISGVEIS